jgi:peroxiredoxin Q/BCP
MARLRVGDPMPAFTLPSASGAEVSSNDLVGKGALVLYFYPKDETLGCTIESCAFRDQHADFLAAGATILGISPDSPDSHRSFAAHHKLPFTLLSDPRRSVFALFGVASDFLGLVPGRETFVVDRAGVVRHHVDSPFPAKHVREALATVRGL